MATSSRWRWQMVAGEVKRQASGFLQDKYKQARLALGDVTPAELLVQEATSNSACVAVPDARTLACIAEACLDMEECWRIAGVVQRRLEDWKEWRAVYKALVVLEFLLTHGPDHLPRDYFLPDADAYVPALRALRAFRYTDHRGFDWGACMHRRADAILALLTDAHAHRRRATATATAIHDAHSPSSSSSSPSSASSRTWSFASDSPDYRHDKKFDAYTADHHHCKPRPPNPKCSVSLDDDDHHHLPDPAPETHAHAWAWDNDAAATSLLDVNDDGASAPWPASFCSRMLGSSRASGFQTLSQPERRISRKLHLQRQLSMDY